MNSAELCVVCFVQERSSAKTFSINGVSEFRTLGTHSAFMLSLVSQSFIDDLSWFV